LFKIVLGHFCSFWSISSCFSAFSEHIRPFGSLLGLFGYLKPVCGRFRAFWAVSGSLEPLRAISGPFWGCLGAVLGPFGGRFGAVSGHYGLFLAFMICYRVFLAGWFSAVSECIRLFHAVLQRYKPL